MIVGIEMQTPTYVYVDTDTGRVLHVVVDDENTTTDPTRVFEVDTSNPWVEVGEAPADAAAEATRIMHYGDTPWPAWEFGW